MFMDEDVEMRCYEGKKCGSSAGVLRVPEWRRFGVWRYEPRSWLLEVFRNIRLELKWFIIIFEVDTVWVNNSKVIKYEPDLPGGYRLCILVLHYILTNSIYSTCSSNRHYISIH